jgi:hypothetical protein
MAMLSRYQKPGGFLQILNLIENCGPVKQEKFLKIIEDEDPRWAQKIRQKMLNMERILQWDEQVLAELAIRLNELTLAVALHELKAEDWQKLSTRFSHSQRRRIEDLRDEKSPSKSEISASYVQIIVEVREMITHGYIRIDKVDPELAIEDDVEDKINGEFLDINNMNLDVPIMELHTNNKLNHDNSSDTSKTEVNTLKQQVILLAQENKKIKSELQMVLQKLNQIRKLSA